MPNISRILMPVDFSERCLGMTPYARAFAEKYQAELILLHVVNPVFITPEMGMAPPAAIAVPQWLIAEKARLLDQFAVDELAGVKVRRLVYEGIPEMQVVELAKSEDVQLVILPTHGYGVFRRFLIGSVTAKVLHDVDCAVLTGVHMEKHAHDGKVGFDTVVCALDMKERSEATLTHAAAMARDFGAKLAVLHVAPQQQVAPDLKPQLNELVNSALTKNKIELSADKLAVYVESGDVSQKVCEFATRVNAGLLIIGREHGDDVSHGRLRTHAYAIIRLSGCPVISI